MGKTARWPADDERVKKSYYPQCIYGGDPILLPQFVYAKVHLQWRFHPTIPRSALSPEVSHECWLFPN